MFTFLYCKLDRNSKAPRPVLAQVNKVYFEIWNKAYHMGIQNYNQNRKESGRTIQSKQETWFTA